MDLIVGADDYIGPYPSWDISMARLNGEMLYKHSIFLSHSTHRRGSTGVRDDVGIVPYIHDGVHFT